MKALCLFSGGLDSCLAALLIRQQRISPILLHYVSLFNEVQQESRKSCTPREMAELLEMPMVTHQMTEEMIALVLDPQFGYGKNLNPCVDCRILSLRTAAQLMAQYECSFLVTGEVVGQRPMSQRFHAIRHIDREAGVEGWVVRPLSAKVLPPTIPEERGWIDREKLFGLRGRSRKLQMQLAAELGLTRYPSPAGGCLLTDGQFAARLQPILKRRWTDENSIRLATVGRHFWLDGETLAIVGRNQGDNNRLERLIRPTDYVLQCVSAPGPTTLVRGKNAAAHIDEAAALTVRYGKRSLDAEVPVAVWRKGQQEQVLYARRESVGNIVDALAKRSAELA